MVSGFALPTQLPSGVTPAALGFEWHGGRIRAPLGLAIPRAAEADPELARLLAAHGSTTGPRCRAGRAHVALSTGALSFNAQVLALLQAADAVGARCLVVVAPAITYEALATLVVNDANGPFPGGIVALHTAVPEYHVPETMDLLGALLGIDVWNGRDEVRLGSVDRAVAGMRSTDLWLPGQGLIGRLARARRLSWMPGRR